MPDTEPDPHGRWTMFGGQPREVESTQELRDGWEPEPEPELPELEPKDSGCFIASTAEDASMNQYWYGRSTIECIVAACEAACPREQSGRLAVACLSTPSIFFSLPGWLRTRSRVFEFDRQWEDTEPNFVFYDFYRPGDLPEDLIGRFDLVVIDPPFITSEVWTLYAEGARKLLRSNGLVLGTTLFENGRLVEQLFAGAVEAPVRPRKFLPSVPHLPYQYRIYSNVDCAELDVPNPDILDVEEDGGDRDKSTSDTLAVARAEQQEPEQSLSGAGSGADFEAMLEAALAAEEAALAAMQ